MLPRKQLAYIWLNNTMKFVGCISIIIFLPMKVALVNKKDRKDRLDHSPVYWSAFIEKSFWEELILNNCRMLPYILHVLNGSEAKHRAFLFNFISQNKWKFPIIITDKGSKQFAHLTSSSFVMGLGISLRKNSNISFIYTALTTSMPGHHKTIVWCSMRCKENVMNTARHFRMFEKRFTWVFVLNQMKEFDPFVMLIQENENISPTSHLYVLILPHFNESCDFHNYYVMNYDQTLTKSILLPIVLHLILTNEPCSFVLKCDFHNYYVMNYDQTLTKSILLPIVLHLILTNEPCSFVLKGTELNKGRLLRIDYKRYNSTKPPEFVPHRDLHVLENGCKTNSAVLSGYVLKIATIHLPPIGIINRTNTRIVHHGYIPDISEILSDYLGFKYNYVIDPANSLGGFRDGKWTGVFGMVYRQEVDIGAMPLTLTVQRLPFVQFSSHLSLNYNVGLLRTPSGENRSWDFFTYAQPFSVMVWIACGIVCMIFLASLTFTRTRSFTGSSEAFGGGSQSTVFVVLWSIVSAGLFQGIEDSYQKCSYKILVSILIIFMMMLSNYHLSLLTSFLTVKKAPKVYNSLDEVVTDGKYLIASLAQSATTDYLQKAESGTFQRAWRYMSKDPKSLVSSNQEGFKMVVNEDCVYNTSLIIARAEVFKSRCSMQVMKHLYNRQTQHLIFPKNSPLAEVVSMKLLSMRSAGIMQRLENTYFPKSEKGACKPRPSMTIPIYTIAGAVSLLSIGIFLALACFIIELVFEKYHTVT